MRFLFFFIWFLPVKWGARLTAVENVMKEEVPTTVS